MKGTSSEAPSDDAGAASRQAVQVSRRERLVEDARRRLASDDPPAKMNYVETSVLTGAPLGTLYTWVRKRQIPHLRLGPRTVVFERAEILRWTRGGSRQKRSFTRTAEPDCSVATGLRGNGFQEMFELGVGLYGGVKGSEDR